MNLVRIFLIYGLENCLKCHVTDLLYLYRHPPPTHFVVNSAHWQITFLYDHCTYHSSRKALYIVSIVTKLVSYTTNTSKNMTLHGQSVKETKLACYQTVTGSHHKTLCTVCNYKSFIPHYVTWYQNITYQLWNPLNRLNVNVTTTSKHFKSFTAGSTSWIGHRALFSSNFQHHLSTFCHDASSISQ